MEQYFYSIDPKRKEYVIPIVYKEWEKEILLAVADPGGFIPYDKYVTAFAEIQKIHAQKRDQN